MSKKPDMLDVLATFGDRIEELETQLEYASQRMAQKDRELDALRQERDAAIKGRRLEREAYQQEIAALRQELVEAEAWMDMPNGPGWWAWDGGDNDRFVAHLQLCAIEGDVIVFKFDNSSKDSATVDNFKAMYPGKWYRLTLPWEQRTATQQPANNEKGSQQ